jgi:hypothetical protein
MILGMPVATFTLIHVVLSLIGIVAGIVVVIEMIGSKKKEAWTTLFLTTTVLTSVTGFFFPFDRLLPSHIVGIISLILLAAAIAALRVYRLAGRWRAIYVVTAIAALYLNVFVAVVQGFLKIPFLKQLAPTQGEPPFMIAQAAVLLVFIGIGVLAFRSFRPEVPALAVSA